MKLFRVSSFVLFLPSGAVFAQGKLLPLANQNLVNINPSFAGSNGFIRNQTVMYYQAQRFRKWSYLSINNCSDVYLKKIKAGIALSYFQDNLNNGYVESKRIAFTYAQHIFLFNKKLKLIPSAKFEYGQKRIDGNKFPYLNSIYYDVYLPIVPIPVKNFYNLSSGLLFNYKGLYFGGNVSNINRPDEGMYGVEKQGLIYGGNISYNLKLGNKFLFNFFAVCNRQNSRNYLQYGMQSVLIKHLLLGIETNYNEDFLASIGYRNNYFSGSFGYALSRYNMPQGNVFGNCSLGLSYNLRSKELRKELTSFETW